MCRRISIQKSSDRELSSVTSRLLNTNDSDKARESEE
jgi:hypothetical protein